MTPGGGGCLVCGAGHASCGPATTTTGVDERMEAVHVAEGNPNELREYTYTTDGGYETTMQLNDADAERMGLKEPARAATEPKSRQASNKARTTENK